MRFAKQRGVPVDVPWRELTPEQRAWVIDGEGSWRQRKWYGVARFFKWLESKAYKMHVRVLLSKYRSYDACAACGGARLQARVAAVAARHARRCGGGRRARCAFPRSPARALRRRLRGASGAHDPRPHAVARRALAGVLRASDVAAAIGRGGRARARRDSEPPALPRRRGPRVPHARPPVAHAVRRRSAANQPHDRARHVAREHAVRARRAEHRPASARSRPRRRRAHAAARRGQHAAGRRARCTGHARRGPHHRHGSGPRARRRVGRVQRHRRRAARERRHADRALPARRSARRRDARPAQDDGERRAARDSRRDRAQLEGHRRRDSAAAARRDHGRQRLGQVDARAGRALQRSAERSRQAEGRSRRSPRDRGRRRDRRRRARRPIADRPHDAEQSRELRRRARADPTAVREGAARARAQVHGRHVQLQQR